MRTVARGALAVLALTTLTLGVGCSRVVDGRVRAAPGLAPNPVVGSAVRQVALNDAELSKLFGLSFRSDPAYPPQFGNGEDLPNGWGAATPAECIGTVVGGQRAAYRDYTVKDIVHEFWDGTGADDSQLTSVAEAVVALGSAADAESAFAKFAENWRHCDGVTVTRNDGDNLPATGEISAVSTGDTVLTAVVQTTLEGEPGLRVTRALGVRVNCLIDVDVFVDSGDPAGSTDRAVQMVRAMMDKVSGLA